jgi:hypothetical protein
MADIVTSRIFADGEKNITATKLNDIVGSSVIQPAFVSSKPVASSVAPADNLLILNAGGSYVQAPASTFSAGIAAGLPPADTTQNGLLKKLSGLATDYVGGDNACHPLGFWTPETNGLMRGIYNGRQFFDDMTTPIATATASQVLSTAPMYWSSLVTGAGSQIVNSASSGRDTFNKALGVWASSNGNANNGQASLYSTPNFITGLGALTLYFRVAFAALPTAAQSTTFRFGICDNLSSYANSITLLMYWNGTAPAWAGQCITGGASSTTATATSPAIVAFSPTALSFYKLKISINAAWNSVIFSVNGVQIDVPLTASIPGAAVSVLMVVAGDKSAGINAPNGFFIDNAFIDYQYATP